MQLGTQTTHPAPPLEQPGAVRLWDEGLPAAPTQVRAQIVELEAALRQHPDAVCGDAALPVTHRFADGCYIRELFVPKGTVYVGKIHRASHPRFLLQGAVLVVTETGGRETCVAPSYLITPAGTKRCGLALEDSVIVTVHVTTSTDLATIEEELIAPDYEALALAPSLPTLEEQP